MVSHGKQGQQGQQEREGEGEVVDQSQGSSGGITHGGS